MHSMTIRNVRTAKKLVRRGESFAELHPDLMDEYSPENEIDPFAVFPGSTKIVK